MLHEGKDNSALKHRLWLVQREAEFEEWFHNGTGTRELHQLNTQQENCQKDESTFVAIFECRYCDLAGFGHINSDALWPFVEAMLVGRISGPSTLYVIDVGVYLVNFIKLVVGRDIKVVPFRSITEALKAMGG